MDINLKKKLSNPCIMAILFVCIGIGIYYLAAGSPIRNSMQKKLYLNSKDYMSTLAEFADYLLENRIEHTAKPDMRYEGIQDINYYVLTETDFYYNERYIDESGREGIKDRNAFFANLVHLKHNSDFYMHVQLKKKEVMALECSCTDKYTMPYLEFRLGELLRCPSEYEKVDIYFLVPHKAMFTKDYLGSEAMQFEAEARIWIFLTIQLSIAIILAIVFLIIGVTSKEEIWGNRRLHKIPFEIKMIMWIVMAWIIYELLNQFNYSEIADQYFSSMQENLSFMVLYGIGECILFTGLGYTIIDCITMVKKGLFYQIKSTSFFYNSRVWEKLYSKFGIDLREKSLWKIAAINIVHTVALMSVAYTYYLGLNNKGGLILTFTIIFLFVGEIVLADWKKMLLAAGKIAPSKEIKNYLDNTGTYRVYIWSCAIIYGILLFGLGGLGQSRIEAAFWFIVVYGCVGYILTIKVVKELQKVYAYTEGTLKHKKQEKPNVSLFNPIIEALTNIEAGFNEAVQKEVMSQRMKTELISNVSHDLKTPLTSIISYIDLLKREDLREEERKQYIEILEQKSQRLKVLIEDLFEASKAASGNIEFVREEIDLVALLKQTLGEWGEKIEVSHLQFKVSIPNEKLVSQLDGKRTYRIFSNLISNILKYATPNSRVYINCYSEEDHVVVEFKNMSACEMNFTAEEITERFKRGDEARHTEGSGLGLAIAKNLTELQGGKFEIYIDGDLFKVTLLFPLIKEYDVDLNEHYKKRMESFDIRIN